MMVGQVFFVLNHVQSIVVSSHLKTTEEIHVSLWNDRLHFAKTSPGFCGKKVPAAVGHIVTISSYPPVNQYTEECSRAILLFSSRKFGLHQSIPRGKCWSLARFTNIEIMAGQLTHPTNPPIIRPYFRVYYPLVSLNMGIVVGTVFFCVEAHLNRLSTAR